MRRSLLLCSSALLSLVVQAGNGIDPARLNYRHAWSGGEPRAVSILSGQVSKNLALTGRNFSPGVDWEDAMGRPKPEFRQQICQLIPGDPCPPFRAGGIRIKEEYLGEPAGFRPAPLSSEQRIGPDALPQVGYGGRRVISLLIQDMGQVRQSLTVSFDDIGDDELRQIALEDAVYRVLRFRED